MKKHITVDISKAMPFIKEQDYVNLEAELQFAHQMLYNKSGAGNDYLGWVSLPDQYDKDEFSRIKQAAKRIQQQADVLLVIGIGGSYLVPKLP